MLEHPENGKNLVKEVQKYKDWNLTLYRWSVRALLMKKIWFEEEKYKIRCLWTQLNFIEGLIEFMEGWLQEKMIFKSIWVLIGRN
jgi:hypothetical protein